MNEDEIRAAIHRDGGNLIDMAREVTQLSKYGPLMNREALGDIASKLEGIAAHAFLLQGKVEQAIAGLGNGPDETQP